MYRKGFFEDSEVEPPNVEGLELYLYAFAELGTCRDAAAGLAPIPFTAIAEYAKHYDVGDLDEFLYVLRKMDDKLLEMEANNKEKKGKQNASGESNPDKNNPNQDHGGGLGRNAQNGAANGPSK